MLKLVFISFLITCSAASAQVGVKSFYFTSQDTTLTSFSSEQFEELIIKQTTHSLQIIELNSFSNVSSSYTENKKICETRITNFLLRLKLESDQITINSYGNRRIPINFKAASWNRIDIYYIFQIKPDSTIESIPDSELVIITPIEDIKPIQHIVKPSTAANGIEVEIPINTRIQFKGGKTKIDDNSLEYVRFLVNTMESNPTLTAQIRGHVCCGPNKRVSRKRAKSVYKELIKSGIAKKRLSYSGYSNDIPIVFPEKSERDRKTNRRVDIIFSNE